MTRSLAKTKFKRLWVLPLLLLALLLAGSGAGSAAPAAPWQAKVDSQVLQSGWRSGQNETEFLVSLQAQADLSGAERLQTRQEKGSYVVRRLMETARRTQAPVLAQLEAAQIPHRAFWAANMIWVRGDLKLVEKLAQRRDVARIYANPVVRAAPDEQAAPYPPLQRPAKPGVTAQWNLEKVAASAVWAAGFTGQGVVIGGQDTGYDWEHPALKDRYRGWDGASADHNYNWHDAISADSPQTPLGNRCGFNLDEPCDDNSHGTHTMGIMVGGAPGPEIGMAPGAQWIGCRNMEEGWGTPAAYAECYQWFMAPTDLNGNNPRPDLAPDIINNSWGCPPEEGCTEPAVLQTVVDNVRLAGILTVHSAGNSGFSGCATVADPAAIYDSSFTVGNTDMYDVIANSSSRGPVLRDGSRRTKPDISAPGTAIFSSVPLFFDPDGYGVKSGTSMAAPHVAGLAALLISARPELSGQVDELERLIEQSAVHLTSDQACGGETAGQVPNNVYGWGRIDALAAFQLLDPPVDPPPPVHDPRLFMPALSR